MHDYNNEINTSQKEGLLWYFQQEKQETRKRNQNHLHYSNDRHFYRVE